jgi:hypothetical protein
MNCKAVWWESAMAGGGRALYGVQGGQDEEQGKGDIAGQSPEVRGGIGQGSGPHASRSTWQYGCVGLASYRGGLEERVIGYGVVLTVPLFR